MALGGWITQISLQTIASWLVIDNVADCVDSANVVSTRIDTLVVHAGALSVVAVAVAVGRAFRPAERIYGCA